MFADTLFGSLEEIAYVRLADLTVGEFCSLLEQLNGISINIDIAVNDTKRSIDNPSKHFTIEEVESAIYINDFFSTKPNVPLSTQGRVKQTLLRYTLKYQPELGNSNGLCEFTRIDLARISGGELLGMSGVGNGVASLVKEIVEARGYKILP